MNEPPKPFLLNETFKVPMHLRQLSQTLLLGLNDLDCLSLLKTTS